MAKKISQLTQATEVKSDDVTVIVQDGETKKLPLNMMVTKQDIENKKVTGLAKLDEIEATYENDTYTPTITVKNKSSVKVGEGDGVDYSANVMDGHVKSAILTGQTLVNIHPPVYNIKSPSSSLTIFYADVNLKKEMFKTNTKYLVRLYNTDSAINRVYMKHCVTDRYYLSENKCAIFTTKSEFADGEFVDNKIHFYSPNSVPLENVANTKILICEYQDGMENWDITYFEGMQSVKMPVLTTSNEDGTKTNILTVNEDVTLRSSGDICDELNLLTGQLTQRIGEDGEVLSQEIVKTVDLIPSGTHPSTTPYCWKDGHIQLSSSGLLPSLEYSVVTSRAGQISQNAAMIVKNDKRIFDLEILLAGGLVNTTYQALTLQNQVETGLSKVSLSSEKEPDYLLYHMIMKLIEEKAYKLDDLAEKVSVFYLYEKLSDEQFETIYAALYPFAEDEYFESDIPGDDEVIEEPIVDESLEEVENEVVM